MTRKDIEARRVEGDALNGKTIKATWSQYERLVIAFEDGTYAQYESRVEDEDGSTIEESASSSPGDLHEAGVLTREEFDVLNGELLAKSAEFQRAREFAQMEMLAKKHGKTVS